MFSTWTSESKANEANDDSRGKTDVSGQTAPNFQTEKGTPEQPYPIGAALVWVLDVAFYMRESSQLERNSTLKSC